MKKTAVLLYPQFSEYELSVALSVLMQGGKTVVTVGVDSNPIKGESGLNCMPDATMDELDPDVIDSLLMTGCMDIFALENEQAYIDFIDKVKNHADIIGSISSSPYLLAKAGLLKGKKYTIGMTKDGRKSAGCFEEENFSDDLVVSDGNIITARGCGFIRFGACFGEALGLDFDVDWYRE
ncbi:4-methyl-5(B-hydroxyethyl)-thiazole monophosphate biosynthesis protein [Bacillus salacetis]|uniref:4-methyl-5(B-hydroxyethyl)-thiazole monophosphate biosynthesis protein n=1 Tax=Bacillus salacetis TaxID=2315464 RepID=A0A3A1QVR2_9BACI|nr:DJ-1/PfpI family protein [Bacillus salacetis]RIW32072.1 4-methyl-5(B-hydroxyethyl)-thiazole monophosphate biosynthesis protein [Bacillus salacetis]